ncbi:chromosome condensation regulator [Dishui Lake large algae virus 1]|nr:chromosome condensation regulator [Dishui Lake large algae virus 1]
MASPFFFQASSSNLIIGGNVGVGTNTPMSKLAVAGSLSVGSAYNGVSAPADSFIVSGNVGIGTQTPMSTLAVAGSLSVGSTYTGITPPADSFIVSGNVGIGTTTLDAKISVVGNLKVAGGIGRWKAFPEYNGGTIACLNTVVLGMDGQIYQGGENNFGKGGNYGAYAGVVSGLVKASMPSDEVVTKFCVTSSARMALTQSNKLYSWGRGQHGILGLGNTTDYYFPQLISTVADTIVDIQYTSADTAGDQECYKQAGYFTSTGRLFLWGYNANGEIGNGTTTTPVTTPYEVPIVGGAQKWGGFSAQSLAVFAWTDDASGNKLYATGYNPQGHMGVGDTTARSSMTACIKTDNSQLTNVKKVRTNTTWHGGGTATTIVLTNDGSIYTAGYNAYGQCGNGTTTTPVTKFYGPVLTNVKDFDIGRGDGANGIFAIKNDGTLWVWGYNSHQQFGTSAIANNTVVSTPVQVAGITDAYALYGIQSPFNGSMFLQKSDKSWWFAGQSQQGVGLAYNTTYPIWTKIPLPEEIVEIRAFRFYWTYDSGYYTLLMLGKSGRLWGTGRNNYGSLGNGNNGEANGVTYSGLIPAYTVLAA